MSQRARMIDLMMEVMQTDKPVRITKINDKCGDTIPRSRMSSLIASIKKDGDVEGDFYTQKNGDYIYLHIREPLHKEAPIGKLYALMSDAIKTGEPVNVTNNLKLDESKIRSYVSYTAKRHFDDARFTVSKKRGGELYVIHNKPVQQIQSRVLLLITSAINSESKMIAIPDGLSIELVRKTLSHIKQLPEYVAYRITTKNVGGKFYLAVG
jgi:hypothetical protein